MKYDNSSRVESARRTRERTVRAAHTLFLTSGYSATTIRVIAAKAGVSSESIYKTFGGKGGLLKAVYDQALVGDDEPVPMRERPNFLALRNASSPGEASIIYAQISSEIAQRVDPILSIVLTVSGSDAALEEFAKQIDEERLWGAGMVVKGWSHNGWVREDLTVEAATDIVWTLVSPGFYTMLMRRGWSIMTYRNWLTKILDNTVLKPHPPGK